MDTMITEAIRLLDQGDCTLVVVNKGVARKFTRRGVADLASLLLDEPLLLAGAYVADKVVGKAAAALMIQGRVAQVFSRVMTRQALAMFEGAGIPAGHGELTDYVANRRGDGRCPLDTICAPLLTTQEMTTAIINFINQQR